MDGGILTLVISGAALVGGTIGWLFRQYQYHQAAKREAAHDAGEMLKDKKTLLENMISKTEDAISKQTLTNQLDEVNAALLGLYGARLRHTLKQAGLPIEEALIADGQSQLKAQETAQLEKVIAEVDALPPSLSTEDLMVLGNAYFYMKKYQDAKRIFDQVVKSNPNDPDALNNRGVILAHLE